MNLRVHDVSSTDRGSTEQETIQVEVGKSDGNFNHDPKQLSKKEFEEQWHLLSKKARTSIALMIREIVDLDGPYLPMLNKIFLASWMIAVFTDPLFLYIPTLDEDQKCLKMDPNLKIVALVFRSITDLFFILHTTFQLLIGFMPKGARRIKWSHILIDLPAVLPIPQMVILVFFPGIGPGFGSKSTKKFLLEMILILQYIPRTLQIYLSHEQLKKTCDVFTTLWIRGGFNFFLYVNASYILGSFWYFFSVQREMECWQKACDDHFACFPTNQIEMCNSYSINNNSFKNITALNEFCPINSQDTSIFDFGMYRGALQSGIVGSTHFPNKVLQSFWWGLRNLSSFGSNLQTSPNPWETCFAALLSMLGLLLFLFLIGNLQLYMQLAIQRTEDKRYNKKVEIKRLIKAKEPDIQLWASTHKLREPETVKTVIMDYMLDTLKNDIQLNFKELQKKLQPYLQHEPNQEIMGDLDLSHLRIIHLKLEAIVSQAKRDQWKNMEQTAQLWMLKNGIPRHIIPMIKKYVQYRLQNHKDDVDLVTLLSVLPIELQRSIKQHLCLLALKKVPLLRKNDNEVFEEIIKHLKPVTYAENTYIIRKGEPIGYMLFITHGVVLVFGDESTNSCAAKTKGDYYGEELVEWQLKSASYSDLPISTTNVQSHTKMEGFILNAVDLKHVLSKYWWKLPISTKYKEELRVRFAVNAIGEARARNLERRQINNHKWSVVGRRLRGATTKIN